MRLSILSALVTSPSFLSGLTGHITTRRPRFLAELASLVNLDCGSYTRDGVNQVADFCADALRGLDAAVERIPHERLGDLVIGRLEGDGPRVLLIGHMDTVFEAGTAVARPFRMDGDRAFGPGVTDMKAGLLAGFHALAALRATGVKPSVTYVCNPDEEIGSPFSSPHIRELAPQHDLAFVLECARANGDLVSARKGVADFHITVTGRAAHAGVEPEKGRSAILEAAHKVVALHALNGRWPGVTVNAGVIEGGTRPNVVAERCQVKVDVRAAAVAELEAATDALQQIVADVGVAGTHAEARRVSGHAPMEKTAATARLVALAQDVARDLGFDLGDASTGGASDANTTSGMGLSTLDGLGPIGGDDHSADEWLDVSSIVPRVALLAGLIARAPEALG
jgi:glutamate carboxypeptidase